MAADAHSSTADTLRNPEAIMGTKAHHASIELCSFSTKTACFWLEFDSTPRKQGISSH